MIFAWPPAHSSLSRYDRLCTSFLWCENLSTKGLRTSQAICNVFPSATALFTGCQRQQSLIKKNTVINLIKAANLGKSTQASHLINQPLQSRLALPKSESLFFSWFSLFTPPCTKLHTQQMHCCFWFFAPAQGYTHLYLFVYCGSSFFHFWTFDLKM